MEQKQIKKLYIDDIATAELSTNLLDGYQCKIGKYRYYFTSTGADFTVDHKEVLETGMGGDTRRIRKREDIDESLLVYGDKEIPGTGGREFRDSGNYDPLALGLYIDTGLTHNGQKVYKNANDIYCRFGLNHVWNRIITTEADYLADNEDYIYTAQMYMGEGDGTPRDPTLGPRQDYNGTNVDGRFEKLPEIEKAIFLNGVDNIVHGDMSTLVPPKGSLDPSKELVFRDFLVGDGFATIVKLSNGDNIITHKLNSKAVICRIYDRDRKYIVVNHEVVDGNNIKLNISSTDVYRIVILKATKDFGQYIYMRNYNYDANQNEYLMKNEYDRSENKLKSLLTRYPDNYNATTINKGEKVKETISDFGRLGVWTDEDGVGGNRFDHYYVLDAFDLTQIVGKTDPAPGNDGTYNGGFASIMFNLPYFITLENIAVGGGYDKQVVFRDKDTLNVLANIKITGLDAPGHFIPGAFFYKNYVYGVKEKYSSNPRQFFKGTIDIGGTRNYTSVGILTDDNVKGYGCVVGDYYYCMGDNMQIQEVFLDDNNTTVPSIANQYSIPGMDTGIKATKFLNIGGYIRFLYKNVDGNKYLCKWNIGTKTVEKEFKICTSSYVDAMSIIQTDGFILSGIVNEGQPISSFSLDTETFTNPVVEGLVNNGDDRIKLIGYTDM